MLLWTLSSLQSPQVTSWPKGRPLFLFFLQEAFGHQIGTAEPPCLSRRNTELILVFVAGPDGVRLISPIHTTALYIILCSCALCALGIM